MMRKSLLLLAVVLLTGTVSAQDAKSVITSASNAMGVSALKTVQYSATGFDFVLGQAPNVSAPWPKFINKSYSREIDFEKPASRVARVRVQGENPPRGGGQQPIVGEQTQNQVIIVGPTTPWAQQLEIWMLPHGFLRAAATKNATVESKTVGGKRYNVISFVGDNKAKVNGYVNDKNLVERVETWIDHAVLGDMHFEAIYTDYKAVDGVQFPMHIVQRQGGHPVFDLTLADVKVNVPVTIEAPQGRGGAQQAAGAPAAPAIQSEKVGDDVYVITGGYTVIAIGFADHVALIESGQNEQRAMAVMDEAKKLFPGKPIKYVVNTHPHVDHAGGLRAFVAEGITIITHQSNKSYLERTLALPHTLNPDRAEQAKKKPIVEGMGDKRVLTDGTHVVELYHLKNFGHHDGTLVAYLPKEKILLQADAYNPPATPTATPPNPPSPYTMSLYDNIQRLKLDVNRIVPVHYPADSRVVTMAELSRWLGKGGTQ